MIFIKKVYCLDLSNCLNKENLPQTNLRHIAEKITKTQNKQAEPTIEFVVCKVLDNFDKMVEQLYSEHTDYLVIFCGDKSLNYTQMATLNTMNGENFETYVVVANKRPIFVEADFNYIDYDFVGGNLLLILNMLTKKHKYYLDYCYESFFQDISKVLLALGFDSDHNGYDYLCYGTFLLTDRDKYYKLYENMYPKISKKFCSDSFRVEHSIRFAIASAAKKEMPLEGQLKTIKNNLARSTNKKLLLALCDYMWNNIL